MADRFAWFNVFHKLWTLAVGTPGYEKASWVKLENQLIQLEGDRSKFRALCQEWIKGHSLKTDKNPCDCELCEKTRQIIGAS